MAHLVPSADVILAEHCERQDKEFRVRGLAERGRRENVGLAHAIYMPKLHVNFTCQSEVAENVSPCERSPVSNPRRNQRTRCSDVPCVNESGTM